MESVTLCVLNNDTVPGTKMVAGKLCWICWMDGWMGGEWGLLDAQSGRNSGNRDQNEKRCNAIGQWLIRFSTSRKEMGWKPYEKLPSAKQQCNSLVSWERTEFIPDMGWVWWPGPVRAVLTAVKTSLVLAGEWCGWHAAEKRGLLVGGKGPSLAYKSSLFDEFGCGGRN